MNLLDQNLDTTENPSQERGLNPLKLAACLLFLFGTGFLYKAIEAMDSAGINPITYESLRLVFFTAGAIITCLVRKWKHLLVAGLTCMLLTGLIPFTTSLFNGYPVLIIYSLGFSICHCLCIARLLANTRFGGRPQLIILLSVVGLRYFRSTFSFLLYTLAAGEVNPDIIGITMVIAALICVLADNEPEPVLHNFTDLPLKDRQTFFTGFLIPFVLIALVTNWCYFQNDRFFTTRRIFDSANTYFLGFSGLSLLVLALLYVALRNTKRPSYMVLAGTGAAVQVLLLLIAIFAYPGQESTYGWMLALLNYVSYSLAVAALFYWIFKYAGLIWLPLLVACSVLMEYLASQMDALYSVSP